MSPPRCTVSFPGSAHPPLAFPAMTRLSEHLTVANSPVLFGCRTGICGTCAAVVSGAVPPPGSDEREVLEAYAPGVPGARLLCQLDLVADIEIRALPGT